MRQVAEAAGVSISTVSRVLADHPDVSQETRAKVLRLVDDLEYRPSLLARGLILKRTNSLGLVLSDITNPFYPELARGIEDAARENGWVVVIGNTERDDQRTNRYVDAMLERSVDGIIFASVTARDEVVARLMESGYPIVLVNRTHPRVKCHMVVVDNYLGARMATEHLVMLGHHRIAHIAGQEWATNAVARKQGYIHALAEAGLEALDELVTEGDFGVDAGAIAMRRLLQLDPRPTAVFCCNDLMALGALEAIYDAGLKCPDDVAVVGFDDIQLARSRLIQLTTISHRTYEMGRKAVQILLRLLADGPQQNPIEEVLEPRLVIRGSCGAKLQGHAPGSTISRLGAVW